LKVCLHRQLTLCMDFKLGQSSLLVCCLGSKPLL
jgi:hypothetical protein